MSATEPVRSNRAIEVRDLHKYFGDNEVLKGIDFHVDQGQVVCVIGPSGSGKSTLLRCVNRLEEPTSGTVLVEGVDITDPEVDLDAVRSRIGMVFQSLDRKSTRLNSSHANISYAVFCLKKNNRCWSVVYER